MNLRAKTVLIISLSVSILGVGFLTMLSGLLSMQINQRESFTLTNRIRELLDKSSREPLELTSQDQLCRIGGENHLEISILYPDQADFATQLQKIEANSDRQSGPLIDKLKKVSTFQCSSARNKQPPPPLLEEAKRLPDSRQFNRERTFYIKGELVKLDAQALELIPKLSPEPKDRNLGKAIFLPIHNVKGEPVAIMQLFSPSPFSQVSESISNYLLILGIALLFFSAILYFILDKFVLSRISRLDQQVRKIKGNLQNTGTVKLGGRDELANLAKTINEMLQRQTTFQRQLHQAKQQLEIVNQDLAAANQNLEKLAKTDGLTQIMNRHFFQLSLEEIWQESLRSQLPISLILCDVDFFKLYNDTYGHLAGDLCLQKVAKAMADAASMEPRTIVARYGGEEFVVILPQIEMERATRVAEKMRSAILQLRLPHKTSKVADFVTLSIGICTLIPQPNLSSRDLISQADQHLYHAKANGRNQVVGQIFQSCTQA